MYTFYAFLSFRWILKLQHFWRTLPSATLCCPTTLCFIAAQRKRTLVVKINTTMYINGCVCVCVCASAQAERKYSLRSCWHLFYFNFRFPYTTPCANIHLPSPHTFLQFCRSFTRTSCDCLLLNCPVRNVRITCIKSN